MAVSGFAQDRKADRKAERQARREQVRKERRERDSLALLSAQEDSVNIGYGYIKRRRLTTSVSSVDVKSDDIATYADIGEYLMGRVPGLTVVKSGSGYKYSINYRKFFLGAAASPR